MIDIRVKLHSREVSHTQLVKECCQLQLQTVIHPVVWVRFEEGRRWPGKMMAELPNKLLLVSFFGTYTARKTPANYVTLHTCLSVSVNANTTSGVAATTAYSDEMGGGLRRLPDSGESKDTETHTRACEELRRHLSLLLQAFPRFRLPAAPASRVLQFSQQIIKQHYGYVRCFYC